MTTYLWQHGNTHLCTLNLCVTFALTYCPHVKVSAVAECHQVHPCRTCASCPHGQLGRQGR